MTTQPITALDPLTTATMVLDQAERDITHYLRLIGGDGLTVAELTTAAWQLRLAVRAKDAAGRKILALQQLK